MNKKLAWTLAELMVAMTFIMLISGFLVSVFKPKTQNTRIQAYAAIRNITKGIIAVDDKYEKTPPEDTTNSGIFYQNTATPDVDTFCLEMADVFTLKQTANCKKSETTGSNLHVPNFVLANGVEFYGLASDKIQAGQYKYKNIAMDVNGSKGPNKLGVDRFPLRIFAEDNLVFPVDCTETQFFDYRLDGLITLDDNQKNPYCKTGKTFNGTRSKINFMLDDEIITYDTYRSSSQGEQQKTSEMVAFSQSLASSICGNFGGKRFLDPSQCAKLGQKIYTKCVMEEMCITCETSPSICPMNSDNTSQTNEAACKQLYIDLKNDINTCLFLIHKPSAALSAVVGAIVGDLDME